MHGLDKTFGAVSYEAIRPGLEVDLNLRGRLQTNRLHFEMIASSVLYAYRSNKLPILHIPGIRCTNRVIMPERLCVWLLRDPRRMGGSRAHHTYRVEQR